MHIDDKNSNYGMLGKMLLWHFWFKPICYQIWKHTCGSYNLHLAPFFHTTKTSFSVFSVLLIWWWNFESNTRGSETLGEFFFFFLPKGILGFNLAAIWRPATSQVSQCLFSGVGNSVYNGPPSIWIKLLLQRIDSSGIFLFCVFLNFLVMFCWFIFFFIPFVSFYQFHSIV